MISWFPQGLRTVWLEAETGICANRRVFRRVLPGFRNGLSEGSGSIWVVVKIMVPFWVPIIIRHLIFRVPRKGP